MTRRHGPLDKRKARRAARKAAHYQADRDRAHGRTPDPADRGDDHPAASLLLLDRTRTDYAHVPDWTADLARDLPDPPEPNPAPQATPPADWYDLPEEDPLPCVNPECRHTPLLLDHHGHGSGWSHDYPTAPGVAACVPQLAR